MRFSHEVKAQQIKALPSSPSALTWAFSEFALTPFATRVPGDPASGYSTHAPRGSHTSAWHAQRFDLREPARYVHVRDRSVDVQRCNCSLQRAPRSAQPCVRHGSSLKAADMCQRWRAGALRAARLCVPLHCCQLAQAQGSYLGLAQQRSDTYRRPLAQWRGWTG